MHEWFRKHFIPHPDNDHRPHFLRSDFSGFMLWILFFAELAYLVPILGGFTQTDFFASILPSVLVDSANTDRQTSELRTLRINPLLEEAAKRKAQDMVNDGYFAHISPSGIDPWHWLKTVGYNFTNAGENLAVNFTDSKDVHTAWMNSPGHRANILNESFTEIGIATATGLFQGQEATFVVEFFGRPAKKVIASATATPLTPSPSPKAPEGTATPTPTTVAVASANTEAVFVEVLQDSSSDIPELPPIRYSDPIEQVISQPRAIFNGIFGGLFFVIALAMVFTMLARLEIQHHPSLMNGLVMVILIIGILIFNREISTLRALIL